MTQFAPYFIPRVDGDNPLIADALLIFEDFSQTGGVSPFGVKYVIADATGGLLVPGDFSGPHQIPVDPAWDEPSSGAMMGMCWMPEIGEVLIYQQGRMWDVGAGEWVPKLAVRYSKDLRNNTWSDPIDVTVNLTCSVNGAVLGSFRGGLVYGGYGRVMLMGLSGGHHTISRDYGRTWSPLRLGNPDAADCSENPSPGIFHIWERSLASGDRSSDGSGVWLAGQDPLASTTGGSSWFRSLTAAVAQISAKCMLKPTGAPWIVAGKVLAGQDYRVQRNLGAFLQPSGWDGNGVVPVSIAYAQDVFQGNGPRVEPCDISFLVELPRAGGGHRIWAHSGYTGSLGDSQLLSSDDGGANWTDRMPYGTWTDAAYAAADGHPFGPPSEIDDTGPPGSYAAIYDMTQDPGALDTLLTVGSSADTGRANRHACYCMSDDGGETWGPVQELAGMASARVCIAITGDEVVPRPLYAATGQSRHATGAREPVPTPPAGPGGGYGEGGYGEGGYGG